MKKRFYTLCLSFLLCMFYANAQTETTQSPSAIHITVTDSLQKPVENATVSLYRSSDNKLAKSALTDAKGKAEIVAIQKGKYYIRISHSSYKQHSGSPFDVTEDLVNLPVITLSSSVTTLSNVTVEGKKPFIERKLDKLIVNVDNSIIGAGSSAFEVLEKSPGVVIDQNENINLSGKAGVIIMIDGKPSPLSGNDLASYLRGLPANAVDRIEIMTNPSARYDASGNAGIINIVMKKDKRLGTNGNINAGIGQGIYHRHNAGINFNYRDKKLNVFGNYNYGFRKFLNDLTIDREFSKNDQPDQRLYLFNHMVYPNASHNSRLGADYYVSNKTVVGVLVSGFLNEQDKRVDNQSTLTNGNGTTTSFLTTNSITEDMSKHYAVNLNFKHNFDSTGKDITIDLDRAVFDRGSLPHFVTSYYDTNRSLIGLPYILDGQLNSDLSIMSAKTDFVLPLKSGARIEAGLKTSFVKADNDLQFFDMSNGSTQKDVSRSNHFIYEENLNAFYGTLSKEFKKWSVQVGLRGEQANIKGVQQVLNEKIDTSYLQLFPSGFLNYNLHKNHTFGVSYSRRIRRPSYNQLNPFQSFIDLTSYNSGNPYLRPQFTDNFVLSYTLKQRTTFSLTYAKDHDVITYIIVPRNTSNGSVSVETYENIDKGEFFGLNISSQLAITKWWNTVTNADIFTNRFDGIIAETQASDGGLIFQATSNHSFILPKKWTGEMSVNFQSPQQLPFTYSKAQWMLSAGVQKVVMKGKGTFRFNVSDVFRTFYPRVTSEFNNYRQYFTAVRDTRIASLNFTYRFGSNTVSAARKRTTGVEDEKNRAQ